MRALGNPRRKTPIEPPKPEVEAPKAEEPAPAPVTSSEKFDESVVIS